MELSFYQIVRFAAPNIMVGNTILLKHASMVPQWYQWKNCLKKRKPRRTIHQSIDLGRRSTALVSDERIKGVSLTGSEAAGSSMAEAAGKYLKNQYLN
jgi:succinate-semialdehyde dehydrogenase/glutarate-semialdehyde dehydrogenase